MHDLVSERHIHLHPGAAQIQITVFQPMLFTRITVVFDQKWRSFRTIQHPDIGGFHLDRTRWKLGIDGFRRSWNHHAHHFDHILLPQAMGKFMNFRRIRMRHHLHQSEAITHIEKHHAAMIPIGLHPAAKPDGPLDMIGRKITAIGALCHRL